MDMIQVSLQPDARILEIEDDSLVLERQGRRMALTGIKELAGPLQLLSPGPADLAQMAGLAGSAGKGGPSAMPARFSQAVRMLAARRLIQFDLVFNNRTLLTAVPTGPLCSFSFRALENSGAEADQLRAGNFQLSRFVYARRMADDFVVECPHRSMRLVTHAAGIGAFLVALARPVSLEYLAREISALPARLTEDCVRFLIGMGVAGGVDPGGRLAEDRDPELQQREFHDVLVHARSRFGLTDEVTGAAFPFAGEIPPAPAVKPVASDKLIYLFKPDIGRLAVNDPPLAKVMEERRSVRGYGSRRLSSEELGEFLYRVGRVKSVRSPAQDDPRGYGATTRTYPSGGAAYELEIYPVVRECAGLPMGIYHYEPVEHALSALQDSEVPARRLLQNAYVASGCSVVPQVLIILAARFSRLSWKYRGIAYVTTLRNVGVLYEAMYLASAAMGLAPCALGGGDSAAFSQATSLDPLIESSVGEFMLGTRP
jgi:oxazoline/thiazoline dehydrogenase